jgi:hypothetical protein
MNSEFVSGNWPNIYSALSGSSQKFHIFMYNVVYLSKVGVVDTVEAQLPSWERHLSLGSISAVD